MQERVEAEVKTPLDLVRRSALTSGIGLLLIEILSLVAHFGIFGRLIVEDEPARTLENLITYPGLFLLGVVPLFMVAALNAAVGFSLKRFFLHGHPEIVNYMSWLRVMYAGVLVGTVSFLVIPVLEVLSGLRIGAGEVTASIGAYEAARNAALILLAGHLFLLAWLCHKVAYAPSILAPFLVIAGIGCFLDGIGRLFIEGYALEAAVLASVGQSVLLIWLLVKARTITV